MVTLPKDFVATQYNGYFWNLKEQRLLLVFFAHWLAHMSLIPLITGMALDIKYL